MSKFKNSQNVRYLQALFYEQAGNDKSRCVYTLKDDDHEGYASLYRAYIETADPTEYTFATQYLDGWEHWEMLCDCSWFKPYVARWRKELSLKIKAEALLGIIDESRTSSKNAFVAKKFLVDGGWEDKPSRGRPTKTQIKDEAKKQAEDKFRLADDFKRIQKELH